MKVTDLARDARPFSALRRVGTSLCFLLVFAGRAADQTALPPVEWVLQHVATNSSKENENDRQFLAHYGFERTQVQEERNRTGAILKHTDKKISHRPLTNSIGVIASLSTERKVASCAPSTTPTTKAGPSKNATSPSTQTCCRVFILHWSDARPWRVAPPCCST